MSATPSTAAAAVSNSEPLSEDERVYRSLVSQLGEPSEETDTAGQINQSDANREGERAGTETSPQPDQSDQTAARTTSASTEPEPEATTDDSSGSDQEPSPLKALMAQPDFDEALRAHRRNGVFDEDELIEFAEAKPDKFVETGLKLSKSQKDQDAYGSEYRRHADVFHEWLEKHQNGNGSASQTDRTADRQEQTTAEPNESVASAIERIRSSEFDMDSVADNVQAIAQAISGQQESRIAQIANQIQVNREELEAIQGRMVDERLEMERERLTDRYNQLRDDQTNQQVLDVYDDLAATGKYETVPDAYRRAVEIVLAGASTDEIKTKMMERAQRRRRGSPRAGAASEGQPPLSDEDKEMRTFLRLRQQHGYADQ